VRTTKIVAKHQFNLGVRSTEIEIDLGLEDNGHEIDLRRREVTQVSTETIRFGRKNGELENQNVEEVVWMNGTRRYGLGPCVISLSFFSLK
jgi:hypothetical protein